MITLALRYWYVLVIAALAAALGLSCMENASLKTRHAEYVAKAEKAAHDAAEAARFQERQWSDKVNEVATNAEAEKNALAADLAASSSAADGLRAAAASAVRRACPRAPAPAASAPQPDPGALDLLVDVLTRHDRAAGELAEFADRLRVAGLACERSFDAIRPATQ